MGRLPDALQREWLMDCLRLLIRRKGADPWLTAELVDLSVVGWFDLERDVARKLCRHADLDHRTLNVPPRRGSAAFIAGGLARDVAGLWRRTHGLAVRDKLMERQLAELTAVYLGFGVLLGNTGDRSPIGPEAVAWLLASQVLSRRLGCIATWSLGRRLPRETRGDFTASLRHLRDEAGFDIAERLGHAAG